MKQIPISLRQAAEMVAAAEILTPSADRTSALPERLLAARFPCFATGKPAPAITNAAAVEILKVFAALDPVPAVSMKVLFEHLIRTARARSPAAIPANSSI